MRLLFEAMKNFLRYLALTLLVGKVWAQSNLPTCVGTDHSRWSNCFGTYTDSKNSKYVGEIKEGKPSGQGTVTYASGSKYVGKFSDGFFNGHGVLTYASGNKYIGEFKDNNPNGIGTATFADGDKYVGEFKEGLFNGIGSYTSADGTINFGEWKNHKAHGRMINYKPDNSVDSSGIFEDGVLITKQNIDPKNFITSRPSEPKKLFRLSSGVYYKGDLVNGIRHGDGAMLYGNGDISIGNFVADRCNGFFLYTKKNGEQFYQVCSSKGTSELVRISFERVSWQPKNPNPSKWYLTGFSIDAIVLIDISSIKKQGNVVTFWSLMNLKEVTINPLKGALSHLSKTQVDCENSSIRITYTYWYPERDGKGSYLYELDQMSLKTEDSFWKPIPPTSDTMNMLKKACEQKIDRP